MKRKHFGVLLIVMVVLFAGYNSFQSYKSMQMPEVSMMNLEALTNPEYDSPCIEWAPKPCHDDFYQNINDPSGYHATCSGSPSVGGGMLECGAVTGRMPMFPYENKKCLECVRTSDGGEVG